MARKSPPPAEHRFKPGVSGNPRGRPKGSKNKRTKMRTPALDEIVRYPVGGRVRRMPRREAIIRFAVDRALARQDTKLMALLIELERKLAEAAKWLDYGSIRRTIGSDRPWRLTTIDAAVEKLGLGKFIYPSRPAQRMALDPALVSLAFTHLGDKRLSRNEQKLVLSFTLTPHKVAWPDWWEPDLRQRKCRVPSYFFRQEEAEWQRALTPSNSSKKA